MAYAKIPDVVPVASLPEVIIPLHLKLMVGGAAGLVGTTAVFPIDVIKTRLQAGSGQGIAATVREVARGGPLAFYRGLPAVLSGALPEKAIKLGVNDSLREEFSKRNRRAGAPAGAALPLGQQIAAGVGAGLAQVVATNPMEIVKIRLQMGARSAADVITELGVTGLYRGSMTTLARDIPFSVVMFPGYAIAKDAMIESARTAWALNGGRREDLPAAVEVGAVFAAGTGAGAVASGLCTPMDVLKTRIQSAPAHAQYAGLRDCFTKTVTKEGYGALWRGLGPRMSVVGPLFGFSMLAFEVFKRRVQQQQEEMMGAGYAAANAAASAAAAAAPAVGSDASKDASSSSSSGSSSSDAQRL